LKDKLEGQKNIMAGVGKAEKGASLQNVSELPVLGAIVLSQYQIQKYAQEPMFRSLCIPLCRERRGRIIDRDLIQSYEASTNF